IADRLSTTFLFYFSRLFDHLCRTRRGALIYHIKKPFVKDFFNFVILFFFLCYTLSFPLDCPADHAHQQLYQQIFMIQRAHHRIPVNLLQYPGSKTGSGKGHQQKQQYLNNQKSLYDAEKRPAK
ncbi:MAG: hypothetical protein V8S96_06150, partial [Lachnospiraceae bacterium]